MCVAIFLHLMPEGRLFHVTLCGEVAKCSCAPVKGLCDCVCRGVGVSAQMPVRLSGSCGLRLATGLCWTE